MTAEITNRHDMHSENSAPLCPSSITEEKQAQNKVLSDGVGDIATKQLFVVFLEIAEAPSLDLKNVHIINYHSW